MKNRGNGIRIITVAAGVMFAVQLQAQLPDSNGGGAASEPYVVLAEKAVPSVVNISTLSTIQAPPPGSPEEFFRRFFGESLGEEPGPMPPPSGHGGTLRAQALGTGFVVEGGGNEGALILTNNHVVEGADEIQVTFTETPGEQAVEGVVVGRDAELDVALIRVKSERELSPLILGDSDSLKVGEYVGAIGNPFGQGHSITHGIISAKGRASPDFPLLNYLQTDAPINPGNSGGPLMDMAGTVVGVNNAVLAQAQGIGFAIPINLVKDVLPQLKATGTVARGYIGVLIGDMTPEIASKLGVAAGERSPFITHVYEASPADKAGIRTYDVIRSFNGKKIEKSADLIQEVISIPIGQTVPVVVNRAGALKELDVKIAQRPVAGEDEEPVRQQSGQAEPRGKLAPSGLSIRRLTPDLARRLNLPREVHGVLVETVSGNSPAEKAGLARGDVILEVDRKEVSDADMFTRTVRKKGNYLLRVRRPTIEGDLSVFVSVLEIP